MPLARLGGQSGTCDPWRSPCYPATFCRSSAPSGLGCNTCGVCQRGPSGDKFNTRNGSCCASACICRVVSLAACGELTVVSLAKLRFLSDRLMLLKFLGQTGLGPRQYVDDMTAPCPSAGAVAAVLSPLQDAACSECCRRARAQTNYEPNETAAMAMLDSPPLDDDAVGVHVASSYKLLGVLVVSSISFLPCLTAVVAKAMGMMKQLLQVARASGFSLPLVASQVVVRLEPCV